MHSRLNTEISQQKRERQTLISILFKEAHSKKKITGEKPGRFSIRHKRNTFGILQFSIRQSPTLLT
jgi:hypothetical protein